MRRIVSVFRGENSAAVWSLLLAALVCVDGAALFSYRAGVSASASKQPTDAPCPPHPPCPI